MIEKLKELFQNDLTTNLSYMNHEDFFWFETEEREKFGIRRARLSEREMELLKLVANPIFPLKKPSIGRWHDYLFNQKEIPSTLSSVRFYYFFCNRNVEEKELLTNTIAGVMNSPSFVWLSDTNGWIVEESPSLTAQIEELEQLLQTITSDFFVHVTLFIGQIHSMDENTREKILAEMKMIETIHPILLKKQEVITFSEALVAKQLTAKEAFSTHIFSNKLEEMLKEKEMRSTMKTFIEQNLNVSQTAKKLFMHRNSVQYRIDKFVEVTGVDIRQFREALAVYLFILHKEWFE